MSFAAGPARAAIEMRAGGAVALILVCLGGAARAQVSVPDESDRIDRLGGAAMERCLRDPAFCVLAPDVPAAEPGLPTRGEGFWTEETDFRDSEAGKGEDAPAEEN